MFDSNAFSFDGSMGHESNNMMQNDQENSFYKFSYEKVDVILTYEDKQDRDYIQSVPVQLATGGGIHVNEVLNYLSGEAFPIFNSRIFFYSYSNDFFIYCGMENAISEDLMIPLKDQLNNNGTKTITLKVRRPDFNNGSPETERTFFEHDNSVDQQQSSSNNNMVGEFSQQQQQGQQIQTNNFQHQQIQQQQQQQQQQVQQVQQQPSSSSNNFDMTPTTSMVSTHSTLCSSTTPSSTDRYAFMQQAAQNNFDMEAAHSNLMSQLAYNENVQQQQQQQMSNNNNNNGFLSAMNQQQQQMVKQVQQPTVAPQKRTRTKHNERTVKEVIELVEKWRALHCGSFNRETNQIVRYSLAEAAKILKVPRKSLDDYLLMMKHAKAFGFDFEGNLNEKFGAIRTFVKNYRSNAIDKKSSNASNDNSSDDDDTNTDASSSPRPVSKKSKKITK